MLAVFASNDGFLFSFINHMPRQLTKMFAIFKSQSSANGDFAKFLVLNNSTRIRFMSQKSMLAIPCNFFQVMSINTKFLCTKYPNFSAQSGSKLLGLPMFMPSQHKVERTNKAIILGTCLQVARTISETTGQISLEFAICISAQKVVVMLILDLSFRASQVYNI